MIATKEIHIPPSIDILYVEQEVYADDTPAYMVNHKNTNIGSFKCR